MSWSVGLGTITPTDQLNSATQDFQPDENRTYNCGESCIRSVLLEYAAGDYAPDTIKDWLDGQGVSGPNVLTSIAQVMSALAHFGNVPSITQWPTGRRNGTNGLLDREWQALYNKRPLIWLGYWIDDYGVVYDGKMAKEIDHWRVVYAMTDTQVSVMDPWHGIIRHQTWDEHYALSKQILVVPTI